MTEANAALRKVSDTYADAITLLIASRVKTLSANEVGTLQRKYLYIPRFLENVPDRGFGDQLPNARYNRIGTDVAASWAGIAAQVLLGLANSQLAALQ